MREGWARVGGARGAGSRERLLGIRHTHTVPLCLSVTTFQKTSLDAHVPPRMMLHAAAVCLPRRANFADARTAPT